MIQNVLWFTCLICFQSYSCFSLPLESNRISQRILTTDQPFVEDILDRYSNLPDVTKLSLGSVYWNPPSQCLEKLKDDLICTEINKYGNILGMTKLRSRFLDHLSSRGLDVTDLDIFISSGGNQAFINTVLALCDENDNAILISPFYCAHKLALQMCGVNVEMSSFDRVTMQPDWNVLEKMFNDLKPKMTILTTPNNPSGYVWSFEELQKLVNLCKTTNTWLVVDQTYYEFLFDNEKHIFPCSMKLDYDKIIHLFSCSKTFGMPGWRVGFLLFPKILLESFRKIQDTNPTHATILSQKLALHCLETYNEKDKNGKNRWFQNQLDSLKEAREAIWPVIKSLGTVYTKGSIYFLIPLPPKITEEEAVDILAKQFKVLLMLGSPFGASGYLRLSYGSIPPDQVISAAEQLKRGFEYLNKLSFSR